MKYLKMLGLAAVAAAALMAFVGAGTASANATLCASNTSPCPVGDSYGTKTTVLTDLVEGTEAILTAGGSFLQTNCKKSEVNGEVETATTPSGKISKLSFEECNRAVNVKKNGELSIHASGSGNGNLTAKGFEVEVTAGVTCIFGGEVKEGLTLTGGAMAKLDATATIPRTGGSFFCPSSAVWHAEYTVTQPEPLYVTAGT